MSHVLVPTAGVLSIMRSLVDSSGQGGEGEARGGGGQQGGGRGHRDDLLRGAGRGRGLRLCAGDQLHSLSTGDSCD